MPPKNKKGKEAKASAPAAANDPSEEAVAKIPKEHGVHNAAYFRDERIQQSPIYFISTHGEYDVNDATDDLFFVCPPNTYIFETAQIQNITSIDIDPYLWYLMQSKNRTLLFEIFQTELPDIYFRKYFPDMDDKTFQYRINALRHVCKHVIYYGPGQHVPIRKLTLSNIYRKTDSKQTYIMDGKKYVTDKNVRASLRVMYASMGFWKFSKDSPYYTFPRVNLDYEYQRTLLDKEESLNELKRAISESGDRELIKVFENFEASLKKEEEENTNYEDEDDEINKNVINYITKFAESLIIEKRYKTEKDSFFVRMIENYKRDDDLEKIREDFNDFITNKKYTIKEEDIKNFNNTIQDFIQERDAAENVDEEEEEEEEETPLDTLIAAIVESGNRSILDIAEKYQNSVIFQQAEDDKKQEWDEMFGNIEGDIETNVPEDELNLENGNREEFDTLYECNPAYIKNFTFQHITPPTTGGASAREPEGCARILQRLYTPLNIPQNRLHVTNKEIVMQDTSRVPDVEIEGFKSPNIFVFSSCAAVTPKLTRVKDSVYMDKLKYIRNLQNSAIEEMKKNNLINPDTELGKSNLYIDTRLIEDFTKVVEDGIIFMEKDPRTIDSIMGAMVKIEDPSLVTEETIPYEDWKYTYTYLDGGVDIFAEKEVRAIANAPILHRSRKPVVPFEEAAAAVAVAAEPKPRGRKPVPEAAAAEPKPEPRGRKPVLEAAAAEPKPKSEPKKKAPKGGAIKSRRKQKIQHTRKHKTHSVRSSTRSQKKKQRRFRKTRRLHK